MKANEWLPAAPISFILIFEMSNFILKKRDKNTLNCQYITQIAKSSFAYNKTIVGWSIWIKQCKIDMFFLIQSSECAILVEFSIWACWGENTVDKISLICN